MQPQNQVTVEVTLEPSDLSRPFELTRRSRYRFTFAIAACLFAFAAWKLWPSDDSTAMLVVAALFAGIFLYPWLKIRFQFRKNPAYRKSRRYTFDTQGMHVQSDDARDDYMWSRFSEIVETKWQFQFMQTDRSGIPIPRRVLKRPDEIQTLRQLIRENFKGTRRLRVD
jgi:hypothetical protein